MACKTKYTEERTTRIIQALRAGNTRKAACHYAAVSVDAFAAWLKRYPEFAEAVAKAEADAEIRNVAIIQRAAEGTWQAAAWWLERKVKADWSARTEQTGPGGSAQRIIVEYEK